MGRHRKPVQAQRKYAHRAFTLVHTSAPYELVPEPVPQLPPPKLLKTQRHVDDMLDIVSFQNTIHSHNQRKVPRVVLRRCESTVPRRELSPALPAVTPLPSALTLPSSAPTTPPSAPTPPPPAQTQPPPAQTPLPSAPSTPVAFRTRSIQKRARTPFLNASSTPLCRQKGRQDKTPKEEPTILSLRNRAIKKITQKKNTKSRIESEEETPLAYYAKRTKLKQTQRDRSKKRKNVAEVPAAAPAARGAPENRPGVSNVTRSANPGQKNTETQRRRPSLTSMCNVSTLRPNIGDSFTESAPMSLYDFIVNIFDWGEDTTELAEINEGRELEARNNADSIARVTEWLKNNHNKHIKQDIHFKVPDIPSWRACPSRAGASSVSTWRPVAPSKAERLLRARCIAWHHQELSALLLDPTNSVRFCGECSRCIIMFKDLQIQSRLASSTDVYEFQSCNEEDSAQDSFAAVLGHVAKQQHAAAAALKNIMTPSGWKIMKVASLLQNKARPGFTSREQLLVAEVIGLLTQCNAARTSPPPALGPTSSKRLHGTTSPLVQSPVFNIAEDDFAEGPIVHSNKILAMYPKMSLCGLVPPANFKPPCTTEEVPQNFKVSNMYVHRMLTRWGFATQELTVIRSIQGSNIQRSPLFDGLEIDLVKLFYTVQQEGGIEQVQTSEKWTSVAQAMNLVCRNKTYAKLENIYLKYLLDYNTLTNDEKTKALSEVAACWAAREMKAVARAEQPLRRQERMAAGVADDELEAPSHLEAVCAEADECVTPGRSIHINVYKKLAEQVKLNQFRDAESVSVEEVESRFWDIVLGADSHVCVHAASVDAAAHATGFPRDRAEPYGVHPWNLKRVRSSSANLLSYLGPCLGVSSSSIHYGMCFSTSCWHKDPTAVPWIEYLHEGAPKIWYSISADQEAKFRAAAEALCPWAVLNKDIWLPSDILMIPPTLLKAYGVEVQRHVQRPGEFVLVYPNTYCAFVCTGYTLAEGVYFAPHRWLQGMETIFTNLRDSCEPSLFPMEQLLISMARHESTPRAILRRVHTVLIPHLREELCMRQRMADKNIELMSPQAFLEQNQKAIKTSWQIQQTGECAYCRRHLYLSRVVGVVKDGLCSTHGLSLFEQAVSRQEQLTNVFCILLTSNEEIYNIINALKKRMLSPHTNTDL